VHEPGESAGSRTYRAVITDWGGVMTNPIPATVRAWLDADGIDPASYMAVIRPWITSAYEPAGTPGGANPVHALERGECTAEEFEALLASLLVRKDGSPVPADGLLRRMFAASVPCDPMYGLMHTVRAAGLRTGLLSNSWGTQDYPRHLFGGLFDAVVISAEVGMRKPEERIFLHAAGLLGLSPGDCVFIDDVEANVMAAEAVGMTAVLHREPEQTAARIASLLGLPANGAQGSGAQGNGVPH
jgi:putative hydrolase of the HAD superfamily